MQNYFDLIVIGAGSGGLAAAKRAASYGARVAVIEGDRVGGTCVIRGCIPKKLLVYGSQYKDYIENSLGYGVYLENARIDSGLLLENVRKQVDRLNLLHVGLLQKAGVELFSGWASFIDANSILITQKEKEPKKIFGNKILISVGGEAKRLPISGSELAWVSDDVFLQTELPESIVVVGAGFIACEMSCIFHGLGIKVTQLVRATNLLNGFDKEISKVLEDNMKERGIKLLFSKTLSEIKGQPGYLSLVTNQSDFISCGAVLFAIGRIPRTTSLNLDAVGVKYQNNRIIVNHLQMTNLQNVFAIGDVSNNFNLTPVAIDEGRKFSDRVFGGIDVNVDYQFIPKAVFTTPEIATVGLSEEEAKEQYGKENIRVYRSSFRSMSQSLAKNKYPCLMKLITNKNSEKIIGCNMVGEHASEIIQMAAISLSMGAKKSDFDKTMALHPTVAEEFVTMPNN